MRVYLPSTLTVLRVLLDSGVVGGAPLPAYAVTASLREGGFRESAQHRV